MVQPIADPETTRLCPECGASEVRFPPAFARPWRLAAWGLLIVGVIGNILLLFWRDSYGAGTWRGKYISAEQWVWPDTTLAQLREIAAGTRPAPTDLSRFERMLGSGGWDPNSFADDAVFEIFLTSRQPILRWQQFSLGWPLPVYSSSTAFRASNSEPQFIRRDDTDGFESVSRGIATWYDHGTYCRLNARTLIWGLFVGLFCSWLLYFAFRVMGRARTYRRNGLLLILVGVGSSILTLLIPNRVTHESIAVGANFGVQAALPAPTGITLGEIRSLAKQPGGESKFAQRLVAAIDAIPHQREEAKPRPVEKGDRSSASAHDEKQILISRFRYENPAIVVGHEYRGWWFGGPWLYTSSVSPVASREGPRFYWWTEFGSLWFNLIGKEPGTARTIAVSIEAMCLVTSITFGPALLLISFRSVWHKHVCQRRASRGRCISCGYDMRGVSAVNH